jgi:thiol-disulfide isomerase/thioredoxin
MKFCALTLTVGLVLGMAGAVPGVQAQERPAAKQKDESRLKVGDPAPKIEVVKWVKGTPVETLDPSKVYVVEFWATWCGPCIRNIPHLTELQKKYKDQVQFIGVSIWEDNVPPEEGQTYLSRVEAFVKEMGERMDYTVAFGGDHGTMADTWMKAANQPGIPAAFIVKEGKIAWIGHPARMDEDLADIVSGKYDPSKAAERAAQQRERESKSRDLSNKIGLALRDDRKEDALKYIDEFIALDPAMALPAASTKFKLLMDVKGADAAYGYIKELTDSKGKDDAEFLNQIAWTILDDDDIKTRDFDYALAIAERADKLTNHKNAAIIDTLARAHFEKGNVDKAIELQEKALAALTKAEERVFKADMEENLARYKAAKK